MGRKAEGPRAQARETRNEDRREDEEGARTDQEDDWRAHRLRARNSSVV
jgi:hypothetical protein